MSNPDPFRHRRCEKEVIANAAETSTSIEKVQSEEVAQVEKVQSKENTHVEKVKKEANAIFVQSVLNVLVHVRRTCVATFPAHSFSVIIVIIEQRQHKIYVNISLQNIHNKLMLM